MKLIFLDVDGTIVSDYSSAKLLPNVIPTLNRHQPRVIALVSNQGGVGLRQHLMKHGPPTDSYAFQLPTEEDVRKRLLTIAEKLREACDCGIGVYFCLYHPKMEELQLPRHTPFSTYFSSIYEWNPEWRKPKPGMILAAIEHLIVSPDECLMVGDRQEDEQAAKNAGIAFKWAKDFFNHNEE